MAVFTYYNLSGLVRTITGNPKLYICGAQLTAFEMQQGSIEDYRYCISRIRRPTPDFIPKTLGAYMDEDWKINLVDRGGNISRMRDSLHDIQVVFRNS